MRTVITALLFVALAALAVLSFAPAELVGPRSGLGSFAGVATAVALVVIMAAGGWMWAREKRKKND